MRAIILAAGYATRVYPLTLETPKSLLSLCGRRLLDYILDPLLQLDAVEEVLIVSNGRFYDQFLQWRSTYCGLKPIRILNDGSTDESNRLGAIGDIYFLIRTLNIQEDVLVLAGDNVFTFDLLEMLRFYEARGLDCVCITEIEDSSKLNSMGVAEVDEDGVITSFEEKPLVPKSSLGACPIYLYTPETLKLFRAYIESGQNSDAPGHFIAWLHKIKPVLGYKAHGICYDIGTPEAYEEIQDVMSRRER